MLRRTLPLRLSYTVHAAHLEQAHGTEAGRPSTGLTALWCAYRLIWLLYTAITFSSVGWSPISLVFPFVLWGVIGVLAAIAAIGFLTRYARASSTELGEAGRQ